jgi:hypothetical protein
VKASRGHRVDSGAHSSSRSARESALLSFSSAIRAAIARLAVGLEQRAAIGVSRTTRRSAGRLLRRGTTMREPDTQPAAPASLSYHVTRGLLAPDELAPLRACVEQTIREQVDRSYYGVSAPLFAEFCARFQPTIDRIEQALRSVYGFRYALCNAMFYENSFYSDSYIAAHVDKVNDFLTTAEFDRNRSIQVWFPVDQTERNGMHLAPRERNEFYRELDGSPDPYELFAVGNRTYFRSRYSSRILFEWCRPIKWDTPELDLGDLISFSQRTLHFTEKIKSVGGYRVAVALRFLDRELAIRPFRPTLDRMLAINDFQFQSVAGTGKAPEAEYLGHERRGEPRPPSR